MKQRKRVKRRGKVARLQTSAGGRKRPPGPVPEWLGYYRPVKKGRTLRPGAHGLAWFKRQGRGYQTRINRALRKLMSGRRSGHFANCQVPTYVLLFANKHHAD